MDRQIFRPEAFGALADGSTNDAAAFWQALDAAAAVPDSILELKKDGVYYLARRGTAAATDCGASGAMASAAGEDKTAAIALDGVRGLTIRGNNTTLLLETPLFYCNINNTERVTLEGLNFDYRVQPFAGARTLAVDREAGCAEVVTDRSLGIEGSHDGRPFGLFGVLDRPDGRWHMFLDGYDTLDAAANRYRVRFKKEDAATMSRLDLLESTRIILPMPGIGHRIERAFSIVGNTDFQMRDCRIWSAARFMFALFRNEGEIRFQRVHIEPRPGSDLPIVGWRDGFHVKENRGRYIWEDCRASGLFDDIFNISASMLNVQDVYADDDIDLLWGETHGPYVPLKPGDTLTVINEDTGALIGSTAVRRVIRQEGEHNRILLTEPLPGVRAGEHVKACFESMVAPGSVIEGCDFRGTFRFRGPIEIRNSYFYVARMWIDLFSPYEGPVPQGVHFTGCRFVCDDEEALYFHLESQRRGDGGARPYHLEDIRFNNCRLCPANFQIAEQDRPYVYFE